MRAMVLGELGTDLEPTLLMDSDFFMPSPLFAFVVSCKNPIKYASNDRQSNVNSSLADVAVNTTTIEEREGGGTSARK